MVRVLRKRDELLKEMMEFLVEHERRFKMVGRYMIRILCG